MPEREIGAVRTPLLAVDVRNALRAAWTGQLGGEPPRATLLILCAQVWLETANGHNSYGWNLAGIKYGRGCGQDFYTVSTAEYVGGERIVIRDTFRSYPSLASAASDYLQLLRLRYSSALDAAVRGDPREFAHELGAHGYYTAPEQQYAAAISARFAQLSAELGEDTSPATPAALATGRPAYVPPDDEPDGSPDSAA